MQLKKDTILSYIEEKLIDSYNSNKGFTTQVVLRQEKGLIK